MSDPDPILEAARAWLNRTFVMRLMDPGLDQSLADLLREQRREGARDAGVAIVKRCCPDCCEHCYNTALEVQQIGADEYRRGRIEGAREMRERAAALCGGASSFALLAASIRALPDEPEEKP